jgi:hypothetical protein
MIKILCFKVNKVPTSPNVNFFQIFGLFDGPQVGKERVGAFVSFQFPTIKICRPSFSFSIL